MGTEVLRPNDYFSERIREVPSCRRRSYYQHAPSSANPRPSNRKQQPQPVQKKIPISKRSSSVDDVSKFTRSSHHRSASGSAVSTSSGNHLAMEKVTILRRGEEMISGSRDLRSPATVGKQFGVVDLRSPVPGSPIYAGSAAFSVSPAPSSLPLPTFSKKKQISFDDSATRDLRRLLRLEL